MRRRTPCGGMARGERLGVAAAAGCPGWIASILLCLGCAADPPRLYCGAGLQAPVAELVDEFTRQHGVTLQCDYAGAEWLLSRIRLSGQGDLYLPGDVSYVELAEKEGLIASKKTVCYFVPVILVQEGNPKKIRGLADLARPGISLGLGDPRACAIGRQSSKIFAKNGIAEEDLEVTVRTATVSELNNYVKLGRLDVVIVWDAVAAFSPAETDVVAIPREQNIVSTVAIGVLRAAKHPELAAQFVEFVTSRHGREVFQKHHYTTTPPP